MTGTVKFLQQNLNIINGHNGYFCNFSKGDWHIRYTSMTKSPFYFSERYLTVFQFSTQAEVPVNWCPALGTVLANEEVVDGVSERGGHPVIRKVCLLYILLH